MSCVQLNNAYPHQRLEIARLQIKLGLHRPHRLLRLAGLILGDSEKEMGSRKLRIELGRVFQRTARVFRLTFPQLNHAKPQVSVRKRGSLCDDPLKVRFCVGYIASLQGLRADLKLLLQCVRLSRRLRGAGTHQRHECENQKEHRSVADPLHTMVHVISQSNGKREPLFVGLPHSVSYSAIAHAALNWPG